MRRKLVAGNWKMNGLRASLTELDGIAAAVVPGVDVAVAVPATLLMAAAGRGVEVGAQDVHTVDAGAHTGDVSAAMIADAGGVFTIVGHSERRADHGETDAIVRAKAEAARRHGLRVILCVGETLTQRDAGQAEDVVTAQLRGSLPADPLGGAAGEWMSVAYEPVWAIGTGRTPSIADVAAMHGAVRGELRALLGEEAERVRVLYGGSVTGDNAAALLEAGDVDGALVGGASLTAAKFAPIVAAAGLG